jgi:dihydrodipicolinate synthase/N-acetylneuraminate lyase
MDTPAIRGCLPALVTPLTPEREIDETGVGALVRHALADGASGILVSGSTGEGTLLESRQRVQLARLARDSIDNAAAPPVDSPAGRRPLLLAGAAGMTVRELTEDVHRLATAGADAVLVLAPHTYPLTPDELARLHLDVADEAEVPTLVYHIPQLTGSALTPETVSELAQHRNIFGMKESSPDPRLRASLIDAVGDNETFGVMTGHAPTLVEALAAGAAGSITAIANLRQWQIAALHAAVPTDARKAERLQGQLARLERAVRGVGASTPAALKAALQLDGLIAERWCRPPLASIPPNRLDQVRTALLR